MGEVVAGSIRYDEQAQLTFALSQDGATMPVVYRGPYEYGHPGRESDYWPQNLPPAREA